VLLTVHSDSSLAVVEVLMVITVLTLVATSSDDDDVNSWSSTRRLKTFVVLTRRDKSCCLAGSRPLNTCRSVIHHWTCSPLSVYSSICVCC